MRLWPYLFTHKVTCHTNYYMYASVLWWQVLIRQIQIRSESKDIETEGSLQYYVEVQYPLKSGTENMW